MSFQKGAFTVHQPPCPHSLKTNKDERMKLSNVIATTGALAVAYALPPLFSNSESSTAAMVSHQLQSPQLKRRLDATAQRLPGEKAANTTQLLTKRGGGPDNKYTYYYDITVCNGNCHSAGCDAQSTTRYTGLGLPGYVRPSPHFPRLPKHSRFMNRSIPPEPTVLSSGTGRTYLSGPAQDLAVPGNARISLVSRRALPRS